MEEKYDSFSQYNNSRIDKIIQQMKDDIELKEAKEASITVILTVGLVGIIVGTLIGVFMIGNFLASLI